MKAFKKTQDVQPVIEDSVNMFSGPGATPGGATQSISWRKENEMRKGTWLWVTIMAALALLVAGLNSGAWAQAQVPLPGKNIPQFANPLPVLDVATGSNLDMETLISDASTNNFTLTMQEFKAKVMPTGFVPAVGGTYAGTTVWGYRKNTAIPAGGAGTYLGPVFVTTRYIPGTTPQGSPTKIKFVNNLGNSANSSLLFWKTAVDQTLHWADPLNGEMNDCNMAIQPGLPPVGNCALPYSGPIPAVPHLHGGEVPPVLDGGPDAWFTSTGANQGHAYYSFPGTGNDGSATYRYPNSQEAAPVWFHDHLLGATRLNVYAGIAGGYVIVDPSLVLPPGLTPTGLTGNDPLIPLVLQDRMFDTNGELFFPILGLNPEHPFWIPEFVGDTIVVNGKVWPFLNVQAKRYRFLFINGSNARTYELSLQAKGGPNPPIYVIGTDGGYLDAPVAVNSLVIMPGERYDVIMDFGGFGGNNILLKNTGRTPFPAGAPPNGATLGRIVQFRVTATAPGFVDPSYNPAAVPVVPIRTGGQTIVRLPGTPLGPPIVTTPGPSQNVQVTRQLTLNEVMGAGGPLEILVNNTKWSGLGPAGQIRNDFIPVTIGGNTTYYSELPNEGDTEVWEIVNLTADAHPIHTHLTTFQLMNRQNFDVSKYTKAYAGAFPGAAYIPAYGPPLNYSTGSPRALGGNPDITLFLKGAATPPLLQEAGWKDTVVMYPGQVTRFVVRYAPNSLPLTGQPLVYPFDPNALGQGYVWHCHIIDHEDNEMMRPYKVNAQAVPRSYVQGVDY